LPIEEYNQLREHELDAAIKESLEDIKNGRISDYYSVSINITYRITIDFLIKEKEIIPINVGKHEGQNYKVQTTVN